MLTAWRKELGGAADAGEGVFHLVGEDGGHAGDAARRVAGGHLLVQRAGGRRILQRENHAARIVQRRGGLDRGFAAGEFLALHHHVMLGDRQAVPAGAFQKEEHRVVGVQNIGERLAEQAGAGGAEKFLGRIVHEQEGIRLVQ
jgi:hypothetical protein